MNDVAITSLPTVSTDTGCALYISFSNCHQRGAESARNNQWITVEHFRREMLFDLRFVHACVDILGTDDDDGRPAFQALLRSVRAGEVAHIVAESPVRFAGNMRDIVRKLELLKHAGATIYFADPSAQNSLTEREVLLLLSAAYGDNELSDEDWAA